MIKDEILQELAKDTMISLKEKGLDTNLTEEQTIDITTLMHEPCVSKTLAKVREEIERRIEKTEPCGACQVEFCSRMCEEDIKERGYCDHNCQRRELKSLLTFLKTDMESNSNPSEARKEEKS